MMLTCAKFAVEKHNKLEHANLKFERVLKAKKTRAKSGWLIHLTIETKDGNNNNNNVQKYEAQVAKLFYRDYIFFYYFKLVPDNNVSSAPPPMRALFV
ncbi:hypothetical protein ABFS82_08G154400 [Erythranthe guttata]